MPTWATLTKALIEGGVVVAFALVAGRYVMARLFAFHTEALAAFREELATERKDHREEINTVLAKYDVLHEDHVRFDERLEILVEDRHSNGVDTLV